MLSITLLSRNTTPDLWLGRKDQGASSSGRKKQLKKVARAEGNKKDKVRAGPC